MVRVLSIGVGHMNLLFLLGFYINRTPCDFSFSLPFSTTSDVFWISFEGTFLVSFSFHPYLLSIMDKKSTRSRGTIIAIPDDDFTNHKILSYEETWTITNDDIEILNSSRTFPVGTIFRSFDARIKPNFISSTWVYLPEYPFTLRLSYPFYGIVSEYLRSQRSRISKTCQQFEGSFIGLII